MDFAKEEKQRREFRDILFYLAESQEILREKANRAQIYKRLENLYYIPGSEDHFRHFYSDIFSVLTLIKQGDKPGSIDILGQNLAEIRKGYQAINLGANGKLIDISDSIRKLYDHVSLDIARIGYSEGADRELSQEANLADIQAQVQGLSSHAEALSSQVEAMSSQVKEINKSLDSAKNAQKEYIAILGIFAAVVLAFTGGIAFSTSVLQNLHTSSIYRIVLVSLVIGLVLVNVLFGLFYYIDRIVNKADTNKIRPLIIANIVLLILMGLTISGWYFGFAEKRNIRIESTVVDVISQMPEENIDAVDVPAEEQ